MTSTKLISAEAQMLIRKPVSQVFEAFIDPSVTKNFWFTYGSGKLEMGKTITWKWEMYNVTRSVLTKEIIPDKKIIIEISDDPPTTAEFDFKPLSDGSTYVSVKQYGFAETGDKLLEKIKDATGGWTTVLDGAKAFLEFNINLNLVADKFPKEAGGH